MEASYFHCSCCDFEGIDIFVAYSRATADAEWFICPECGEESSNVEEKT